MAAGWRLPAFLGTPCAASLRPWAKLRELIRQLPAASEIRPRIAPAASAGMLTRPPSASPVPGVRLRTRLTLIRLALIRNPWPCGVPVSHRDYRYSCLQLLFHALPGASRPRFPGHGMLPYRRPGFPGPPGASVARLTPGHHPRTAARLVSCYALFE